MTRRSNEAQREPAIEATIAHNGLLSDETDDDTGAGGPRRDRRRGAERSFRVTDGEYRQMMQPRVESNGNVVVLTVRFDAYETLLAQAGDNAGARIAYDGEALELMSPSADHEHCNRLLEGLVVTLGLAWEIDIESAGSTTLKREPRGAEPDSSFYVANAARFVGKRHIDLAVDPPPDIVVEIDISRTRIDKRVIYAALGVPEFWRYDGTALHGFGLAGREYRPILKSGMLAGIAFADIARFLESRTTLTQSEILRTWQRWLQSNAPGNNR
jgi:Uma2 family endonuclease